MHTVKLEHEQWLLFSAKLVQYLSLTKQLSEWRGKSGSWVPVNLQLRKRSRINYLQGALSCFDTK